MKKFTHKIKSSGQLCRKASWWPNTDQDYVNMDKRWPLMYLESGQVTKVSIHNLKALGQKMLRETLQEHIQDGEIKIQDDEFSLVEVVGVIKKEASTDFDCMVDRVLEHDSMRDLALAIVKRDVVKQVMAANELDKFAEAILKEEIENQIQCNFEADYE